MKLKIRTVEGCSFEERPLFSSLTHTHTLKHILTHLPDTDTHSHTHILTHLLDTHNHTHTYTRLPDTCKHVFKTILGRSRYEFEKSLSM